MADPPAEVSRRQTHIAHTPRTEMGESTQLLTASACPHIGPWFAWLENFRRTNSDATNTLVWFNWMRVHLVEITLMRLLA